MKKRQLQEKLLVLLVVVPVSLALSGCFVFDEIQKGMDIMDEHTPLDKRKPKVEPEPERLARGVQPNKSGLPEMKAKMAKFLNNALKKEPVGPDPNDGVVRCELRGSVVFTRESDCKLRGGRFTKR